MQARATATDKLLGEAREHLLARAEDIRDYDRRIGDIAMERDALQARVSELEAERIKRESELTEIDQARNTYMERSATLARAFTTKEAALARAEDAIAALNERIGALEATLANDKQSAEQHHRGAQRGGSAREAGTLRWWKARWRPAARISPA